MGFAILEGIKYVWMQSSHLGISKCVQYCCRIVCLHNINVLVFIALSLIVRLVCILQKLLIRILLDAMHIKVNVCKVILKHVYNAKSNTLAIRRDAKWVGTMKGSLVGWMNLMGRYPMHHGHYLGMFWRVWMGCWVRWSSHPTMMQGWGNQRQ